MIFFAIRQSLSLKHAIVRYNRRFDAMFQVHHFKVLFVISSLVTPSKRSEILVFLGKRSHRMNYTILDKALRILRHHGLIKESSTSNTKKYFITPAGIELLVTLERWIRGMRNDHINVF